MRWNFPDTGGTRIAGYEVTVHRGGQDTGDWKMLSGESTTATLDGLDNGVGYIFTVEALNASGWGKTSDPSNAVVPGAGASGAPASVQATGGNNSATIHWSAPHDGGSPITEYLVRAYLGWTANVAATREVPGNATTVTMLGVDRPLLANGTIYTFTVQARNANVWGPESARSNAMTPGPFAPHAPSDVHVEVSGSAVNLSWSAPFNGGSPITSYVIRTYAGASSLVVADRVVDASATSATIAGLAGGRDYSFSVFAINPLGWSPESGRSNLIRLATVPDAPISVRATAGIGSAVISWVPGASEGGSAITGYVVTAYQGGTMNVVTTVTARNLPPTLRLPGNQTVSCGES